jgi:methylmalonyl-CoA mutase N-terminal domain/subunit
MTPIDYDRDLGNPGSPPFTRGIHANMYRGKKFTMRQLTGFGGPEETNQRMKYMLDRGATGLSIVFDLPTIQMYDSDDPLAAGQVGFGGVAIDSVEDMEILFDGIPIDQIPVSLVTHYPSNTAILFPMYLVMAERRGIPWTRLRGTVQNDTTMEEVVRSGIEFITPRDCFRIQCDNIEFIRTHVPLWNCITFNGYNLRECGTSIVTETAVAFLNAITTLNEMVQRGYDVDFIGERFSFFWAIGNNFFEEIARMRAARRLWYKIMKDRMYANNLRSMWMRCHAQTSGISLEREEPKNNIVRAAYQALAAILGGTQSLHVDSYDEAFAVPTEEAALVALRTQQIIQRETGIMDVPDPLGGSFYLEALTTAIESRIVEEINEMEAMGGYVAIIEKGWLQQKTVDYFYEEWKKRKSYNKVPEEQTIEIFEYPKGVERRQRGKLRKLRAKRPKCAMDLPIGNIMEYALTLVRKGCTEGELYKLFKLAFEPWEPPIVW